MLVIWHEVNLAFEVTLAQLAKRVPGNFLQALRGELEAVEVAKMINTVTFIIRLNI